MSSEILSKEIYNSQYIYLTTPIKKISNTIFDSLLRHMNLPNISKFPIILHTSETPPTHSSHQNYNGNLHGYHRDLLDFLSKTIITVDPKAINDQRYPQNTSYSNIYFDLVKKWNFLRNLKLKSSKIAILDFFQWQNVLFLELKGKSDIYLHVSPTYLLPKK